MQQTISEHLGLDVSTVQNFFMNARRRCRDRFDPAWDQPKPNQKVINLSPPSSAVVNDPVLMATTNFAESPKFERPQAKSSTVGQRSNVSSNCNGSFENGTSRRSSASKPRRKSNAVAAACPSNNLSGGGGRTVRENWDSIDQIVNLVAAGHFHPQSGNSTASFAPPAFTNSGPILTLSEDFATTPVILQPSFTSTNGHIVSANDHIVSTASIDATYTSIFDMKDLPLKLEMKDKSDISNLGRCSNAAAVEKAAASRSQSLPFIGTLMSRDFTVDANRILDATSSLGREHSTTPAPSMLIHGCSGAENTETSPTLLTALTTMQPMGVTSLGPLAANTMAPLGTTSLTSMGVASLAPLGMSNLASLGVTSLAPLSATTIAEPATVYQSTLLYPPPPIGMAPCSDANSLPADFLEMPLHSSENSPHLGGNFISKK